MGTLLRFVTVVAWFIGMSGQSSWGAADQPTQATLHRLKAATGLVVQGDQVGTAFCVHPQGVFVTAKQLLREGQGEISVVLGGGTENPQVLPVEILPNNTSSSLVVLKTKVAHHCVALELGTDQDLTEMAEVIVPGFSGATAGTAKEALISIHVTQVLALRMLGKSIGRVELKYSADQSGQVGSPVLTPSGKVIGVRLRSAVNDYWVTPVNPLRSLLTRPNVKFTPPVITKETWHAEHLFEVDAETYLMDLEPLAWEVNLQETHLKAKHFPLTLEAGKQRARIVPFPTFPGRPVVAAEVQFEDGTLQGLTEVRGFRMGPQAVQLDQVEFLRLGTSAEAILLNGTRWPGPHRELSPLQLIVGNQRLPVDLARAQAIQFKPYPTPKALSCEIVARLKKNQVYRSNFPLYVRGVSQSSLEYLAEGKFVEPLLNTMPETYVQLISLVKGSGVPAEHIRYQRHEITATAAQRQAISIKLSGSVNWSGNFAGASRTHLKVGEYRDAQSWPHNDLQPTLSFTSNRAKRNPSQGEFVVWEIKSEQTKVWNLAIDFIQHCEDTQETILGVIRINSKYH